MSSIAGDAWAPAEPFGSDAMVTAHPGELKLFIMGNFSCPARHKCHLRWRQR